MPRHLIFFQWLLLTVAAMQPLLTCVSAHVRAEGTEPPTSAPSSEPKIQVQALAPGANLAPFEKDSHYETHPSGASPSGTPTTHLLPPRERDRLIAKAGLSDAVSGWDAVDRDVLLLRARTLSPDELKGRYPTLPAESLKEFQALVR